MSTGTEIATIGWNTDELGDSFPALEALREEDPRKAAVAEAYATSPTLASAARIAGVNAPTVYGWKKSCEKFQSALEEVRPIYGDTIREVIHQRAFEGYEKPVIYKGQLIWRRDPLTGDLELDDDFMPIPLTERVVSDRMLERLAGANLPEYAQTSGSSAKVNVGLNAGGDGTNIEAGVEIQVNFVDPPDWDKAEWGEDGRVVLEGTAIDVTPEE